MDQSVQQSTNRIDAYISSTHHTSVLLCGSNKLSLTIMSRIDQYRPNHESHGSRFDDRQARSPRRSPSPYYCEYPLTPDGCTDDLDADTYTRPRSRSPGPRPMPPRDGRARGKGRRPTNPGGIFKGLKYHCVSSEDDSKQSRRLGFRMNVSTQVCGYQLSSLIT